MNIKHSTTILAACLATLLPLHGVEVQPAAATPHVIASTADSFRANPLFERIASATTRFITTSGETAPPGLRILTKRNGESLCFTLVNDGAQPVALREIVLADVAHGFPSDAAFYGEGMSMFCSTAGTVGAMTDLDGLTDAGHYKLPVPEGFRTVYNYLRVTPAKGEVTLVGFSSCRRFHGKFNINADRLQIVVVTENLTLAPGEKWELEQLVVATGADSAALMDRFAQRINANHPRLVWPKIPNGWCSWYCYWDNISSEKILTNLAAIKQHAPELRYIQIDDGYQPQMGDWLESTEKFSGGVQQVISQIKEAGFEPAIWVAPFIASPESKLFKTHPDWFVRGEDGKPLSAGAVTFGGWRQGPWYMLDGTHPEARAYLEQVFRTMREWGVTYFKLDANNWGSLPFGRRFDEKATSVEAYRHGMEAVRRGAGTDAYILGCNHAYWPSLGEIHGSRTSYDIAREWPTFAKVARQNLSRNWMNDRLWWNDPDCLLIPDVKPAPGGFGLASASAPDGKPHPVTADQFSYHAAATYASGGMVLSGDALVNYSPAQWSLLRRALARPPIAARFADDRFEVGVVDEPARRVVILLNASAAPATRTVPLGGAAVGRVRVTDFWTGEDLGSHSADFPLTLAPTSGRVLVLTIVENK